MVFSNLYAISNLTLPFKHLVAYDLACFPLHQNKSILRAKERVSSHTILDYKAGLYCHSNTAIFGKKGEKLPEVFHQISQK